MYQQADSPVPRATDFTGPVPFVEIALLLCVHATSVPWFVSRRKNTPFPETSSEIGGLGELRVLPPIAPRVLAASARTPLPDQSALSAADAGPFSEVAASG